MSMSKYLFAGLLCLAVACQAHGVAVTVPVPKPAALGESPNFSMELRLPVSPRSGQVAQPEGVDQAVWMLRSGIDRKILEASVEALRSACGTIESCRLSSPEVWDRFIENTEAVPLEGGWDLSGYLATLDDTIASQWKLDDQCRSGLCVELARYVRTSPPMFARMLIWRAIAEEADREMSMQESIDSMGDMVRPVKARSPSENP